MAAVDSDTRGERKGLVDHFLSIFADVKANEGLTALVLLVDVFLLLVAYYLLKTVREPLILASGGVQAKNYATAIQAVVLMGLVPAYAALTQRLRRMTLITVTLLFFASNLLLFWVLAQLKVPGLGGAFFVWLGCFSLVVLAQFWSFANDLYTPDQGKRLFAIVGIGASVGAWVGSKLAEYLTSPASPDSKDPRMSEFAIMLISAALLLLCLGLGWLATFREGGLRKAGAAAEDKPIGGKNGIALIRSDRYLMLIAAIIMILNLVNTTGESILDLSILDQVKASTPNWDSLPKEAQEKAIKAFVGPFRGNFFSWVNLIGAVTQMFLVSRIFKYLGIRAALFSLPLIGLLVYGGIVAIPLLAFVRIGKIAENSVDYSLYNTTKQALWLPTTREEKYNAKMTIDSFLVRIGDLVASGLSLLLLALGLGIRTYAAVNLALIAGWLLLALLLGRENEARTEEKDAPKSDEAIKKQLKNTVTAESGAIREAIEKAKREKKKS